MAKLLSGATLRKGGSGQFITLSGAQPQLPPTDTTSTGYTVVTDELLRTSYRSSLGNLEFNSGTIYSNIPNQNIVLTGTGTGIVVISSSTQAIGTNSGALVVNGGVGINKSLWTGEDIHVNGLTIGQGWEGLNNIVIQGIGTTETNEFNIGQSSIAIGFDALQGISTAYKNIAIGRFALSSGTNLSNSIAIGDSALKNIGVYQNLVVANITNVSQSNPVEITTDANHNLSSGTNVIIINITGTTELNDQNYYIGVTGPQSFTLYSDNILNIPVDGSGFTSYIDGGVVLRPLDKNDNVAIGSNAAINLIDGKENFFLGYKIAQNLTTGSYNFFIGHEVGTNMTTGDANISIGGDNLVDGLNNQINIGSVFYYNGAGYLQLNSDTGIGFGTTATNQEFSSSILNIIQSTETQILTVDPHGILGGEQIKIIDVLGMTELNNNLYYVKTPAPNLLTLYYDNLLTIPVDSTGFNSYAGNGSVYKQEIIAALAVLGGLGVSDNAIINGDTASTSTYSGALVVTGGVGVGGSIYSADGNPLQNNLLYTPKVTITNTGVPPTTPNIGDFWFDTVYAAEMQYIQDGTSTFWIQISSL